MTRDTHPWKPVLEVVQLAALHWQKGGCCTKEGLAPTRVTVKAETGGMVHDLIQQYIKATFQFQQVLSMLPNDTVLLQLKKG